MNQKIENKTLTEPLDKMLNKKNMISSNEFINGINLNYIYLQVKISDFPCFDKIKISVETRDQGWSTISEANSFFNLRVVDSKGNFLAEKLRIIENYGEADYKIKIFYLNKNDEFLGKFLKDDNIIQLIVRSQYLGWETFIKYGEIKIE